ncbi:hypothetical protein [Curvivirga aplysinae]|uniref:hypothetical protein n=1 Tax=Curvivirga aplysinae TaxID=2529852 RepID=UPI0012BC11FF|nr:hypothetical protein [Curvivirga aplysinae]MTI08618.1 hypothetical protein [Curvivirga aplysinae]
MKFLIFNVTVAAALGYLVFGEELGLTSVKDEFTANTTPEINEEKETLASLNAEDLKPMIAEMITVSQETSPQPLSEDDIKTIVANAVADALAHQQMPLSIQENTIETHETPYVSEIDDTTSDLIEEELPTTVVKTPVTHAPSVETGGLGIPEKSNMPVQVAAAPNNIQLAEGEAMMTPQSRQKELDKLVNSLELMFLDLSN